MGSVDLAEKFAPMKKPVDNTGKDKRRTLLNPDFRPLTPEKLKELSGLDLPDGKAQDMINAIRRLCKVLFHFLNREKNTHIKPDTLTEPKKQAV
jgi:hypothetical protein